MKYVLHVVGCLEMGGTEAFIMNIYRNIDRTKIQFDFLVLNKKDYPYITEIKKLGGEIFWGIPWSYKRKNECIRKYVEIMKTKKYAVVHSHINVSNSWVMLAAKKANIPIRISHAHGITSICKKNVYSMIQRYEVYLLRKNATHYFACSQQAGETLYGEKWFTQRGRVIKNGIDVSKFVNHRCKKTYQRKIMNIPQDCNLVLGNISRFDANKNQSFILDIFCEILKTHPKAILLLGGVDAGDLDECKRKAKALAIEKNIMFIGVRTDVQDVLKAIDIYLFPSFSEGLGIALLEAQAAGCSCVASTSCPADSNMGIGLIKYVSLSQTAQEWSAIALKQYYHNVTRTIDESQVLKSFSDKGYSVNDLVDIMADIYIQESICQ